MKLLLLIFFFPLLLFSQQRDVRVYREFINGKTVVFADNNEYCPVSLATRTELVNLKSSLKEAFVLIPAKTKRYEVMVLSIINKKKSVSFKYQNSIYLGNIDLRSYDINYPYSLPYNKGEKYLLSQGYNGKISHHNEYALDFTMPIGTDVLAARDGIIVDLQDKNSGNCIEKECAQLNNFVMIYHEDGTFAEYTHIDTNSATVKKGDVVKKGDKIASSGNVGWSTGPHLHFFTFVSDIEKGRISIKSKFKITDDEPEFLKEKETYLQQF